MSSRVTFFAEHIDNISLCQNELIKTAERESVGVFFFDEQSFELKKDMLVFDVGDTSLYDNCESLLRPWWFDGWSTEKFLCNMNKLATLAEVCLTYTDTVHLFIGNYDNSLDEFAEHTTELISFVDVISELYVLDMWKSHPTVRITITK